MKRNFYMNVKMNFRSLSIITDNYLSYIHKSLKIFYNISLIIISTLLIGCSSTEQIVSKWNSEEINIDGNYNDWVNNLTYIKDKNVSIGIKNNDNFIYLCLIVENPSQAIQILRRGFIVWFVPEDKSKIIGLKYPLGILESRLEENFDIRNRPPISDRDSLRNEKVKLDKMVERLLANEQNFQIVDENKYPLWLYSINNDKDIKIKMAVNANKLVYELQIPLSGNHEDKLCIQSKPGDKLKITFETEEIKLSDVKDRPVRNFPQGEFRRPSGNMRRTMPSFSRVEPLNFSIETTLVKTSQ
ncbi:hypothetical protein [Rosettibacter firmus]|uniref:hypothetical protein n=1 Tax=Rosettibacter firmus TaxID=3111522 RepID=UPI00336C22D6